MNRFTKGEWSTKLDCFAADVTCNGERVLSLCKPIFSGKSGRNVAHDNARLIATAGTTATKLAEAGYDAVKVLEVLPELVSRFNDGTDFAFELLEQCRGE